MKKPSMAVLYGQPREISTSFQTAQFSKALETWFDVFHLHVGRGRMNRILGNYVKPLFQKSRFDYIFYANDGLVDLARWDGKKILYWYDAPADWVKTPPAFFQFPQWLRYQNIKSADHVFAVSSTQVRIAKELRNGNSTTYLPVGVNCQIFDPSLVKSDEVRKRFGLPNKTIIGYLGYLSSWNNRFSGELLLETASDLLAKQDVHFLIVGFGPALSLFKERVAELKLSNHFTFTGFVPDNLVPGCIAAMDICIDTLEEGFHSEARSETKLKQYMAMGRACVATAIGENITDLYQGKCGVLVKPGRENLFQGILSLCSNQELRKALGEKARKRAQEEYDWKILALKFTVALGLHG
jgi:glycosyltransferase involved in cell wall biosynthesis